MALNNLANGGNGGSNGSPPVKVCSIGPSRGIAEELTPALLKCLPGAALSDIRSYPSPAALESQFLSNAPDICFLEMASDRAQALALIPKMTQASPGTEIIVLLTANDPDLILKSLRLGASEFLLRPFSPEQLEAALSKISARTGAGSNGGKSGRVVCLLPAKGACGASTIALNLSQIWKRDSTIRVLLADMDPLTGILSFLLKVKPQYTFLDVLARDSSLDADLWKAMVSQIKGLDALLAPEELVEGLGDLRDASPIIDFARRAYDLVVLDAGKPYGDWNLSMARNADDVLLVTTNELPALQGAQRVLAYLETKGVPIENKVRIVLNRYDEEIGLGDEAVASALHAEVVGVVPSDFETVEQALIEGKAIPSASKIGKSLSALAAAIRGVSGTASKKSSGSGLFSFFSRAS